MVNNDYIYTPASTDITIRWKTLYGYIPPSQQECYKKKWADFKSKFNRTLEESDAIFIDPQVISVFRKPRKQHQS